MAAARRVLLVGWSAADWRLLDSLLASGSLPNLARLLERGARGNLRTLQPQFGSLLWTSLATGRRADAHGVLTALLPNNDDTVRPLSRLDRQGPALWNMLDESEHRSLIVNWPVTYPAEPVQGACVSDLFTRLAGGDTGLEPLAEGATWPIGLGESLADLRFSPAELGVEEMAFFVPGIADVDAGTDPLAGRIAVALAETVTTHGVVTELLQAETWHLAMVRYDFLEALGPEIWACHPPQLPYVPDEAFERCSSTLVAACRYLDLMLGVLLDTAGEETLVMLVSERGLHCDHLRPQTADVAFQAEGGAPWFREQGVVAIGGPGIRAGGEIQAASLLDVAPTVLNYLDLPIARDMPGRVLAEAFNELPKLRYVESHDEISGAPRHGPRKLTEAQRAAALKRWQELGLLDQDPAEAPKAATTAQRERDFNLAMVALDARRPRKAIALLEHLHEQEPGDDRITLHLARTLRAAGQLDRARELLEKVVDHTDQRPHEQMLLAELHLSEGDHDQALMCLFKAEQADGQRPQVHSRIGRVYLAMQRWDEAERAFGKALERDAEHAEGHLGMAATRLGQKRHEEGIHAALRAVELNRNQPRGHYLLGKALLGAGKVSTAAEVLETCLALQPNHLDANRQLVEAHRLLGEDARAQERAERVRQLESAALLGRQLRDYRR
ncbi:MAG: tetratricopeptide repeat protein [Xanthomonadales bacterium]|nr:tetratricopeptide repeat protein [Xanthomonadales bacterium]